jgi:hypothetical protein
MTVRAYHLTPADHALSNLRNRRLKIATFNDLNDPFELWAVAQPDPRLRAGLRAWKKEMALTHGILCFSKTWDNPVLWSHYADRHRGIALGFDINPEMVKAVDYKKRRPPFRGADESSIHTLLYTKHRDWHYEKELRVYLPLEEPDVGTGLYFSKFSEHMVLREIITGPLCASTKQEIEAVLGDEGVAITKGRLAFTSFNVVTNQRGFRRR